MSDQTDEHPTERELLEMLMEIPLPERGPGYGAEVWARVSARLPEKKRHWAWRSWVMVPACGVVLGLVFLAGMWTERLRPVAPLVPPVRVKETLAKFEVAKVQPPLPAVVKVVHHSAPPKPLAVPPSDAEQDARLLALNALLETDAKAAVPEILTMVHGDTSNRTKEHALFVLAQGHSAEGREALLDFARQPGGNPALQSKAVRMLGLTGDEGERKQLAGLYRTSSNPVLKREILNGLQFSEPLTIRVTGPAYPFKSAPNADRKQILTSVFLAADSHVLLDLLKKQPDPALRVATIRSLSAMGEQSQVLPVVYRTDTNDNVRTAVLDGLAVQQNTDALEELARDETDGLRKTEILARLASVRAQRGK